MEPLTVVHIMHFTLYHTIPTFNNTKEEAV